MISNLAGCYNFLGRISTSIDLQTVARTCLQRAAQFRYDVDLFWKRDSEYVLYSYSVLETLRRFS